MSSTLPGPLDAGALAEQAAAHDEAVCLGPVRAALTDALGLIEDKKGQVIGQAASEPLRVALAHVGAALRRLPDPPDSPAEAEA